MRHLKTYLLAVAVMLFAASCTKGTASVFSPGPGGGNGPSLASPSDDQQLDTLRPTLTVTNSAAKGGSGARTYYTMTASGGSGLRLTRQPAVRVHRNELRALCGRHRIVSGDDCAERVDQHQSTTDNARGLTLEQLLFGVAPRPESFVLDASTVSTRRDHASGRWTGIEYRNLAHVQRPGDS